MEENLKLQDVSLQLYRYLSDNVVGSEKVVRCRQLYFKILDEINFTREWIIGISSGSKVEGVDLPGSDVDTMFLFSFLGIFEKYDKRYNKRYNELFMDTNSASPGFTLLKYEGDIHRETLNMYMGYELFQTYSDSYTEYSTILPNLSFKELLLSTLISFGFSQLWFRFQGPSLVTPAIDSDMVPCIQCYTWPPTAKQWFSRSRHGWPSPDLIDHIKYLGVLVVPVGNKFYSEEGNGLEWRLSFSLAEKLLVHSFNHTQILCYSLLKIFLKEIIKKDKTLEKLLCSYFMKTLLFWVLEEVDQSLWIPKKLLFWFFFCIERLLNWILCNYIPNYFIPEHNLIDGKLSNESKRRLAGLFHKLLAPNGLKLLLSANSLKNFKINSKHQRTMAMMTTNKMYRALYSLYPIMIRSSSSPFAYRDFILSQNKVLSKFVRNVCALSFIQKSFFVNSWTENNTDKNSLFINKKRYRQYKKCLSLHLIGTYADSITGWFLLVIFYYINQEYDKMFQVLETISEILSLELIEFDKCRNKCFMDVQSKKSYCECKSFMKRIRHEVVCGLTHTSLPPVEIITGNIYSSYSCYREFSFLNGVIKAPGITVLFECPVDIIFQYLKLLYYLKRMNNMQIKSQLHRLQTTVETTTDASVMSRISGCYVLDKAYTLSNPQYKEGSCIISSSFETLMRISSEEMENMWIHLCQKKKESMNHLGREMRKFSLFDTDYLSDSELATLSFNIFSFFKKVI